MCYWVAWTKGQLVFDAYICHSFVICHFSLSTSLFLFVFSPSMYREEKSWVVNRFSFWSNRSNGLLSWFNWGGNQILIGWCNFLCTNCHSSMNDWRDCGFETLEKHESSDHWLKNNICC
jgi:hypothetical protein